MKEDKQKHLPVYGAGPLYGGGIILLTVAAVAVSKYKILYYGIPDSLGVWFSVAGLLLFGLGVYIWIRAVLIDKLADSVKANRLLTTGIYAWVRNPIYTALLFICTGVLFWSRDIWLLALPFVFWAALTALMKRTEEKWLKELYGAEYEEYCQRVNRCIPWFPSKSGRK